MESSHLCSLILRARNRLLELGYCCHCFSSSLIFLHLWSLQLCCCLHQQRSVPQPEPEYDCSLWRGSCLERRHTGNVPSPLLPQPNQQNKTKQIGWCGIIIGKNPPPHHTTDVITFYATSRQPRKLILCMQPCYNPIRINIKDDLNIFENGRRPQFF